MRKHTFISWRIFIRRWRRFTTTIFMTIIRRLMPRGLNANILPRSFFSLFMFNYLHNWWKHRHKYLSTKKTKILNVTNMDTLPVRTFTSSSDDDADSLLWPLPLLEDSCPVIFVSLFSIHSTPLPISLPIFSKYGDHVAKKSYYKVQQCHNMTYTWLNFILSYPYSLT